MLNHTVYDATVSARALDRTAGTPTIAFATVAIGYETAQAAEIYAMHEVIKAAVSFIMHGTVYFFPDGYHVQLWLPEKI